MFNMKQHTCLFKDTYDMVFDRGSGAHFGRASLRDGRRIQHPLQILWKAILWKDK